MKAAKGILVSAAVAVTLAALGLWLATDRHFYTKFEVVERVPASSVEDDLFAGTGLFEADTLTTVRRREFHFGLLPTPERLFDRHTLSVLTFVGPAWAVCLGGLLLIGRKEKRSKLAGAAA